MTLYSLVNYIEYRIFRVFVEVFYSVIGRLTGWSKLTLRMQADSTCDTCEVCWPIARRKAYEGDLARIYDFILWHKSFVPMESLIDPKWTTYCVWKDWVYFVYSWRTMRDYQSRKVPFLYLQQFPDAELVARMSIAQFCRFSQMLGLPKPKVFFMSNAPRAGTTLLTTMLQASDRLIGLSEPDIFDQLAIWKEMGQFDHDTLCRIVKTSFSKICHEFTSDDTVIIKPPSNGGIMVPEIYATLPDHVNHLFLYRKTVDAGIKSIQRWLIIDGMVNETIAAMKISETLAIRLIGFTRYHAKQFTQFRPQTELDYAHLLYVGPLVWLLEQRRKGIPIHITKFEDLVGNSRETMKRLFEHLGVLTRENEDRLLSNALDAMAVDSQAGTFLSNDKMAKVPFTPLTAEIRTEFDERNKQLGLPPMFVNGFVPDYD